MINKLARPDCELLGIFASPPLAGWNRDNCLVTFLSYLSINGGFVLDEALLLRDNLLINTTDGLSKFWCTAETQDYWPMTYTSLWIEWRLWATNPAATTSPT